MHSSRDTLKRFYSAFAMLDADTMATCYAPDVQFDDAVFSLHGHDEVTAMWRMLCQSIQASGRADWKLNYRIVAADAQVGIARWSVRYRFGPAGRVVDNRIEASFQFAADGRIAQHHDQFDFWLWSRQALGLPGVLLGWTPLMRRQVRARARARLDRFVQRQRAGSLQQPPGSVETR